jgi:hypothetical protein
VKRRFSLGIATVISMLTFAGVAQAAVNGTYYLEGNGTDLYSATITVSNGEVSAASFFLHAQQCTTIGSTTPADFEIYPAPFSPVAFGPGGSFSFSTAVQSPGTGTVAINGTVSANGTMTGLITLSDADFDGYGDTACSGSYQFTALTTVGPLPTVAGIPGFTSGTPARDYVTYAPVHDDGLSFNYRNGVITDLAVQAASLSCGKSVDGVDLTSAEYGQPRIHVRHGGFTFQTEFLDGYHDALDLTVRGRLKDGQATGTMRVTQVPDYVPYIFAKQGACRAFRRWTATPPPLNVSFSVALVRLPFVRGWRYVLIAQGMQQTNGANAVRITVAGHSVTTVLRTRPVWISGPISLNHTYVVKVVALKRKGSKLVASTTEKPFAYTIPPGSRITWQGASLPGGSPPG